MSPRPQGPGQRQGGFPRVSGDEPLEVLDGYVLLTFSPRERG